MDILNQIINSLSKEEIRYFKIFAKRLNNSDDRQDFRLFDYVRKSGENYNEDKIWRKLYGTADKASFYRLKNRLLDYTGDFLTLHNFWKNDSSELNRHLSLYTIFLDKRQFKVAYFYLKKAEQKAAAGEYFEALDVIYGNYIRLSGDLLEINPEEYIVKRNANAAKLNRIRETDHVLAAFSYRLKLTQNVAADKTDALKILNATINDLTGDDALKKSKSFQTRSYRAVSQILLQQHNYPALEVYLKETYSRFESGKWFDRDNHEIKLQMLTYLINSLFRNARYDESLHYAGQLGAEIHNYNNLLYDKYLFFYYNSLVINYSALDRKKALVVLEEFEREIKNKKNSYYDQFLYFNKAMILHQVGRASEAIRNIVRLYVNDNYKNADDSFKLKISVAELIMQFDAGDSESYMLRSNAVKQQFKNLLSEGDFERERDLVKLVDKMVITPGFSKDKKLKIIADKFISAPVPASDTEIINYSAWLTNKWRGRA